HLSESKVQAMASQAIHGRSLTRYLADLGILSPRFVAAHGVWIDDTDIKLLAEAGASVAHNPGCNARLGSGIAPVREMLAAGINIPIGTHSCPGSGNPNIVQ